MFEKWRMERKLKDFRGDNVRLDEYKPQEGTITLKTKKRRVVLAFKLIEFDGKIQLAFSGDVISSDGEALSRVMKAMWNEILPKFPESDELRKQLEIDDSKKGREDSDGFPVNEPSPIYFRDMADRVAGVPNEVVVTVKASYRIDKE